MAEATKGVDAVELAKAAAIEALQAEHLTTLRAVKVMLTE